MPFGTLDRWIDIQMDRFAYISIYMYIYIYISLHTYIYIYGHTHDWQKLMLVVLVSTEGPVASSTDPSPHSCSAAHNDAEILQKLV